jgi:hypothetical protein
MTKRFFGIALMAMVLVFGMAFTSCSNNSSRLAGNWEQADQNQNFGEHTARIEFSGRNFTLIDYVESRTGLDHTYTRLINHYHRRHDIEYPFNEDDWNTITGTDVFGDETELYHVMLKGTYSVSGDNIEMTFPDGSIAVYQFSRTENTITIDRVQFNRKR